MHSSVTIQPIGGTLHVSTYEPELRRLQSGEQQQLTEQINCLSNDLTSALLITFRSVVPRACAANRLVSESLINRAPP